MLGHGRMKREIPITIRKLVLLSCAYLVYLPNHCVQHFTFKWTKHYGFVLNRKGYKPLSGQNQTGSDTVDCRYCYHETIPLNMLYVTQTIILRDTDLTFQCKCLPPQCTTWLSPFQGVEVQSIGDVTALRARAKSVTLVNYLAN